VLQVKKKLKEKKLHLKKIAIEKLAASYTTNAIEVIVLVFNFG